MKQIIKWQGMTFEFKASTAVNPGNIPIGADPSKTYRRVDALEKMLRKEPVTPEEEQLLGFTTSEEL